MAGSFADAWGGDPVISPSLSERIRMAIRGTGHLRRKMVATIRLLERDVKRLNSTISRFDAMELSLTGQAKTALLEGDNERAWALSNEIANVRMLKKLLTTLSLYFEQMASRLRMILTIGDAARHFGPLLKTLRAASPIVAKVMPQLGGTLSRVSDVLEDIVNITRDVFDSVGPMGFQNEEAERILRALKLSVEHEADMDLPDVEEGLEELRPQRARRRIGGGNS